MCIYRKACASLLRHHGRHTAYNRASAYLSLLLAARSYMQSSCSSVCGGEDTRSRAILTEHECAQEKLYLIWRAGMLMNSAAEWADSLARLQAEGECDYFCWLMRVHPPIY